jgi:hypothetical protein
MTSRIVKHRGLWHLLARLPKASRSRIFRRFRFGTIGSIVFRSMAVDDELCKRFARTVLPKLCFVCKPIAIVCSVRINACNLLSELFRVFDFPVDLCAVLDGGSDLHPERTGSLNPRREDLRLNVVGNSGVVWIG